MSKEKVKLPRTGPSGKRLTHHPLVQLVRDRGGSMREVANGIKGGLDRTSVSTYYYRAMENRDLLVPADWVLDLAKMSGLPPHYFRPDVYPKEGVPAA